MTKLLITGATGFIGRQLCESAVGRGFHVRAVARPAGARALAALRATAADSEGSLEVMTLPEIDGRSEWGELLAGCDTVLHLAGLAHVRSAASAAEHARYAKTNTAGTLHLANQAARRGVRRLVFLSTIQVLGNRTQGRALREEDPPNPETPYARSKWQAEQGLHQISKATGLETVIIRPGLVYGAGVKANFRRLLQLVQRGIPMPLANVHNVRHMTAMNHLLALLLTCATDARAAGETFHCADAQGYSTPSLLRHIAQLMNLPARLFPVPRTALALAAHLPGIGGAIRRLTESMEIDAIKAPALLDYTPADPAESLRAAVAAFQAEPHAARR